MENLGINLTSFLINTAIFCVFFLAMHFLVLKKVGGIVVQRQKKYQEAEEQTVKAEAVLTEAKAEFDRIIGQAKEQTKNISAEAKEEASFEAEEIIKKAQRQAEEIIEKAQGVLTVEREKLTADFNLRLEKSVKSSLGVLLADQADKIEFDEKVLQ